MRSRVEAPYLVELEAELGAALTVYAADQDQRLNMDAVLSRHAEDLVYVCGPNRLLDAVQAAAAELGLPAGAVHFERFSGPIVDAAGDRAVTVHLARSDRQVEVPAGLSILEALEAEGLQPAASCRIGNCGVCATQVLAGEPDHRDAALSPEARSSGKMCICISRAKGTALTLDL